MVEEEKRCCEAKHPQRWIKGFLITGIIFNIINVCWYWFLNDDKNVSGFIITFYVIFFCVIMTLTKVVRMEKLLKIFVFMNTKGGPGLF